MDTNVSSGNSNADSILFSYAQQQQVNNESPIVLKTGNNVYSDTTDQAATNGTLQANYNNYAGNPSLTPPAPGGATINGKELLQMYQSGTLFMNSVASNSGNNSQSSSLSSIAQQFLTDSAQIQVSDPQILALAQKQGEPPGLVYKQVQFNANTLFEQQLTNLPPGLPATVANLLRYANGNPQAAASLSPQLQRLLKSIQGKVNTQLQKDYGFSASWQGVPPNNTFMNAKISTQYDGGFHTLVNQYAQSNNLSSSQVAQLTAMHYMPGAQTSDPTLNGIFNQINQQNNANMQASYGAGYTPQADTGHFTQVLNGAFRQNFQTALQNQQPALSSADQSAIIALYANPNDTSVSAADKTRLTPIMQSLTASSTTQVSADFGLGALGVTWTPVVTTIINPAINPAIISTNQKGLAIVNEVLNNAEALVNQMPPGPQKNNYKDYLKAIANAIADYQQFLYSLQGSNASVSSKLTSMSFEEQTNALQKQEDAIKQQEQQHGKTSCMPTWLGDITTWMTTIIGSAMLGPALGPFYVIDKIVSEATGKPSLVTQMFSSVTGLCSSVFGPTTGPQIAPYANLALCVSVSSTSPMICAQMLTNESQSIQGIVGTMGGNAEAQQITAMAINMTVQIGFMIAMSVLSGGASAAFLSEELLQTVADTLNISVKTIQTVSKAAQAAMLVYGVTTGIMQGASNIMQGVQELAQREVTLEQGVADAYSVMVQALVQAIKKVIAQLQQSLAGTGTMITDLSSLSTNLFSTASQIASDISGASSG